MTQPLPAPILKAPNPSADKAKAVKGALLGFILLLSSASVAGFWLLSRAPDFIFLGVTLLFLWSSLAAIILYLFLTFQDDSHLEESLQKPPRFATHWQWLAGSLPER